VKRVLTLAVLVCLSAFPFGCRGGNRAEAESTATIAPAKPPQTSSDEAILTQTTEVGDERSPNESGEPISSDQPNITSSSSEPAAAEPPIPPPSTP